MIIMGISILFLQVFKDFYRNMFSWRVKKEEIKWQKRQRNYKKEVRYQKN